MRYIGGGKKSHVTRYKIMVWSHIHTQWSCGMLIAKKKLRFRILVSCFLPGCGKICCWMVKYHVKMDELHWWSCREHTHTKKGELHSPWLFSQCLEAKKHDLCSAMTKRTSEYTLYIKNDLLSVQLSFESNFQAPPPLWGSSNIFKVTHTAKIPWYLVAA